VLFAGVVCGIAFLRHLRADRVRGARPLPPGEGKPPADPPQVSAFL
jgi:hypothetical protein